MHGCRPLDGTYYRITKMEDSILYELDGKPIVKIIDDLFGNHEWQKQHPLAHLTIGVNYGKRYGEPEEDMYVNRLITGVAPDGQGICLFEPDLEQGMEIQFMLRDTERMMDSARENSEGLVRQIKKDQRRSLFGLYIDCAGRTAAYSNNAHEEASEVQEVFKRNGIPLLGCYSGVEISPFIDKSRGLDWTGVLIVFAEDA
jgi:small ligand-binding sensory domain FIST